MPCLDWGPSWVTWNTTGDYVGWAPRMPDASRSDRIPGGAYTYVQTPDLPATDLKARTLSEADLGREARQAKPLENLVERDGVVFDRGPSIDAIERRHGPLTRAHIEDLVPVRALPDPATVREGSTKDAATPDQIATMRRAAERVAGDARALSQKSNATPARLPVVRPFGVPSAVDLEKVAPAVRKGKGAPPDTTR
jgi:hypothetical protein